MGQKVNPIGLRLGINRTWDSRWFAGSDEYGRLLHEDIKIRAAEEAPEAGRRSRKIVIERPHSKCRVTDLFRAPGRDHRQEGRRHREAAQGGRQDDRPRGVTSTSSRSASPRSTRTLVAESIAQQLERRVAFRRAMKRAVQSAMRLGAEGIRINCSRPPRRRRDRAPWSGIAKAACRCTRCAPTSTTASPTAITTYGTCGIKVWIFKGEILEHDPMAQDKRLADEGGPRVGRRSSRSRGVSRTPAKEARAMLQPKKTKFRKQFKGRIHGAAKGGTDAELRPVRPEGHGAGARHRAPDRGGPPCASRAT